VGVVSIQYIHNEVGPTQQH